MRRKVLALGAVAIATSLVLAGCTSRNDDGDTANGGAAGGDDKVTVAFVPPKLQGIPPYFEAMNAGGQQAAEELGIEWLYQARRRPTPPLRPTSCVRSSSRASTRSSSPPNDPDSMAPLLQEAKDAGIAVATSDTDAPPDSVRQVFVNQASVEGIGIALTEALMDAMGGKGKYAIVSCGETAANLNAWIEVQKAHTAEAFPPDAEIVDVVFAGEDQAAATAMATDLMNAHPPDLTGLVGECTSSAPGVAQAVRDAGKIGQVFTVGLGTPQSMKPYLEDGSSSASILWDVEALGFLTAWAGLQLAEGNEFQATNRVSDALPPAVEYDATTNVLLLGDPLRITVDNAGDFDY